ncbi:MAG: hypothetical protein IPK33_06020 [Gemmatimonadetes bacterium]|nr:hypothetical protein [Gemmatimonadota bacterium]
MPLTGDVDGVERVDFLNNMTAMLHGHADPESTPRSSISCNVGRRGRSPARAGITAQLLIGRVPSLERIRFANSGTGR